VNVVVDASVTIKWFVPEPLSDEADRLLGGGDALFAPDLGRVKTLRRKR
jgi:predicted nucleic acid-binding protein